MADDDLKVTLTDEQLTQQTDKGGEKVVIPADEGISGFKEQLTEAQRRADEAAEANRQTEARARQAEAENQALRNQARQTELKGLEGEVEKTKADIKDALEMGDYAKVADLNAKLADHAAAKRDLERVAPQTQQPAAGDLDGYLQKFSGPARAWLSKHTDCLTDPRKNNMMLGAHHRALADGLQADTPDYFAFIERDMGIVERSEPEQRQPQRPADMQAPVSRQPANPGTGRTNPREVSLSKEEVDMASSLGMTTQEYARQKLTLTAQGLMGPNAQQR